MKRMGIILILAFFTIIACTSCQQSKNTILKTESMEITDTESKAEETVSLPDRDSLENWLGVYEQKGIRWDDISGEFDIYIYCENGTFYGYLCVYNSETGTSCYLNERIRTEIRGSQDMILVYFLEKQWQFDGCYHKEYPDLFDVECGESNIERASDIYGIRDLLFTIKREGDAYSAIEGRMILGKDEEGAVSGFTKQTNLTMDYTCETDKEIFLKMFREKEQLTESDQPDYTAYDLDGKLILNLYLDSGQESGTGIYYGETLISKYITQFDIDSWEWGRWEDPKYSLIRAGEKPADTLDEYEEYTEYNNQGRISSFYSEGIVTGWGEPRKEKLVQIEFFYRAGGTLERKECYYNHHIYGTTRRGETFYFNAEERLTYDTAYVTHGMLSDYYFYIDGKRGPVFCLMLDHMGGVCSGSLVRYSNPGYNDISSSADTKKWQDAYAELLRKSLGSEFYFCDIDRDGIPELLIARPSACKMIEYDVYAYKRNMVECLGLVTTFIGSGLWLDGNGGISGYSYGAGGGGGYRWFIDNGELCYDGETFGYTYDYEGNRTEWFRGADGSKVIVTEENKPEYEKTWKSMMKITIEQYTVTDDTISTVIYGEKIGVLFCG